MSGSRHFEKIAWMIFALVLVVTVLFVNGEKLGLQPIHQKPGYENRLFDHTRVHTIHIVMEDWENFIENAATEVYQEAVLVIDGKSYKSVGIRGKGNTSLSSVAAMNSHRYSFKVEFDHYDSTSTYYGLDKFSLNNLVQDATMMKDYLTYTMMKEFGVATPLCSFVYLTVNGQDHGLYLAVEGVEDAFLTRNYGDDYGVLYRPEISWSPQEKEEDQRDVKLQYIDDQVDSYNNIWENAKTEFSNIDQKRLISSLKQLSRYQNLEKVVDIEQVIRYFVVHSYVCNEDSYTGSVAHNYYLYEKDGKMAMIPWDYNLAFGTFSEDHPQRIVNTPIDSPVIEKMPKERPMWNWILKKESYEKQYHKYFLEFLKTVDAEEIIDHGYSLIKSYVEKDPTAFYTMSEFEKGVETLRQFCILRKKSILKQLESKETVEYMEYANASHLVLSAMGTMEKSGNTGEEIQSPYKRPASMETSVSVRESWGWIGGSILVLFAGLVLAQKFR